MIKRELKIKNFRNLGLNDELTLIVNPYLSSDEKEHGDLVILVGPNNVGKSNVLDALELSTSDKDFNPNRDINDDEFYIETDTALPKLILSNVESSNAGIEKRMENKTEPNHSSTYLVPHDFLKKYTDDEMKLVSNFVNQLNALKSQFPNAQDIKTFCASNEYEELTNGDLFSVTKDSLNQLYNLLTSPAHPANISAEEKEAFSSFVNNYGLSQKELNEKLEYIHKIKLEPKVYRYVSNGIDKNQFVVDKLDISKIEEKSPFICSLLKYIDVNVEEIKTAYAKAKNRRNNGVYDKVNDEIKSKMAEIIKTFNDMFPLETDKQYEFTIKVDSGSTGFNMSYGGNDSFDYDKQSQGFKWFFEFYFNLIVANNLGPNDIVILDEPCAAIHENGIKAFRNTIKDFTEKTGITFVVVTHRASFVDVDYLDEVRVISRVDGNVKITNEFNSLPGEDVNVLKPLLDNLLAGRNMLFDNRASFPIYVEGITDYNYLTGYKYAHYKDKKPDFIFLPINGIKHDEILKKIGEQEFASILLVDSNADDFTVTKESSNKVMIIKLNEIDQSFHNIEDLFSEKDRKKYNLGDLNDQQKPEKNFCLSHHIKREFMKSGALSSETVKNFEKVFNYLADKIKKIKVNIVFGSEKKDTSLDKKVEPTISNENE